MGTFFGVLAIIQGIIFIIMALSTPRGKANINPTLNIMIGLIFIGVGLALIG